MLLNTFTIEEKIWRDVVSSGYEAHISFRPCSELRCKLILQKHLKWGKAESTVTQIPANHKNKTTLETEGNGLITQFLSDTREGARDSELLVSRPFLWNEVELKTQQEEILLTSKIKHIPSWQRESPIYGRAESSRFKCLFCILNHLAFRCSVESWIF